MSSSSNIACAVFHRNIRCIRGSAQNPDVFFQARETVNPFYARGPDIVQKAMDNFAKLVGRAVSIVRYVGSPDAERVVMFMGSGRGDSAKRLSNYLQCNTERKSELLKVRLFRPFCIARFRGCAAEDRKDHCCSRPHKRAGGNGEPLISGCGHGVARINCFGNCPSIASENYRRQIRSIVERIHACYGQGCLRRDEKA